MLPYYQSIKNIVHPSVKKVISNALKTDSAIIPDMNNEPFTFHIDPTPTLPTRRCRLMARTLGWALSYGNYLIALIVWWMSDWFFAVGILLLGIIVFGILRSKLRNDAIPPAQHEYAYDDYAIATWYLSRTLCFILPKE